MRIKPNLFSQVTSKTIPNNPNNPRLSQQSIPNGVKLFLAWIDNYSYLTLFFLHFIKGYEYQGYKENSILVLVF